MLTNLCKICNNKFETNLSFTKYCSDDCRKQARILENNRYTLTCNRCGCSFQSYAKRQKYCSVTCGAMRHDYNKNDILRLVSEGEDPIDVAKLFIIPVSTVRAILQHGGVSFTSVTYNRHMNQVQESLIRGGLLGDTHASRVPSGKYRAHFVHGPLQYQYLDWKYSLLIDFVNTPPKTALTCDGAFGTESRTFSTVTNATITNIASQLYSDNIKRISINYLNLLDSFSIAVWFMDDGSLSRSRYKGNLSTHNFTESESQLIASWLAVRYETGEPHLVFDYRCQKYSLHVHAELAYKIAAEINPIVFTVPCMAYKTEWYRSKINGCC